MVQVMCVPCRVLYWLIKVCQLSTVNCQLLVLVFCLFHFHPIHAQDTLATGPSSLVTFPTDLDSARVDSFYLSRNIDLRNCNKPELYFEIYRWYRTCYHYGGSNSKGIDCSHFVNMLYEKIYGITLASSAASIYTQCKPLKGGIKNAQEGDLIFFKIRRKRISHVGIYLGDGKFAHASTKLGVIISEINEEYYHKRFYKAGRID